MIQFFNRPSLHQLNHKAVMNCLILGFLVVFLQGCYSQESGETETIRFIYEGHTRMLLITRQATCYIFTLTDNQLAMVHNDATLRQLELQLLAKVNDANTQLTTVPHNALHTNILRECGKGMTQFFIIQ
ncbi:hypothetical protein ACF0H5_004668 [Mactra antiquata]